MPGLRSYRTWDNERVLYLFSVFMIICYRAIDNSFGRFIYFMKSGIEPDDLLELSCSIYFIIRMLCPGALLGYTSPVYKGEKK